jgi:hypothetical protein
MPKSKRKSTPRKRKATVYGAKRRRSRSRSRSKSKSPPRSSRGRSRSRSKSPSKRRNPYFEFLRANQARVMKENPGLKMSEISKILGEEYRKKH